MPLQTVLCKHRGLRAANGLSRRPGEIEAAGDGAVGALDEHGPTLAGAVVLRVQKIDAELEQMRASWAVAMSRDHMDKLIGRSCAMLTVEKIAECRVRLQFHRGCALGLDVGPRLKGLECGFAQRTVSPHR